MRRRDRGLISLCCAAGAAYKLDGWQGYDHWLGTNDTGLPHPPQTAQHNDYQPFEEGLHFARSLKLTSEKAWRDWCKTDKPSNATTNVTTNPQRTYKDAGKTCPLNRMYIHCRGMPWQFLHLSNTGHVANHRVRREAPSAKQSSSYGCSACIVCVFVQAGKGGVTGLAPAMFIGRSFASLTTHWSTSTLMPLTPLPNMVLSLNA